MILSDRSIRALAARGMIKDFVPVTVREDAEGNPVTSYGLDSYGYDVRVRPVFKMLKPKIFAPPTVVEVLFADPSLSVKYTEDECLSPKRDNSRFFETIESNMVVIPPHGFCLAETVEGFDIPDNVTVQCWGKSSYARLGAVINPTSVKPGFKGTVVIEISNTTDRPLEVYANEGISHFEFHVSEDPCESNYEQLGGLYQNQSGVQECLPPGKPNHMT